MMAPPCLPPTPQQAPVSGCSGPRCSPRSASCCPRWGTSWRPARPSRWWTLLAGFLGVFAVVAPLAGRERSLPSIAAPSRPDSSACTRCSASASTRRPPPATDPPGTSPLVRFAGEAALRRRRRPRSPRRDAQRIVTDAGIDPARVAGTGHAAVAGTARDGRHDVRHGQAAAGLGHSASWPPRCCPRCPCCSATCSRRSPPDGCCGAARPPCCGVVRLAAESVTAAAEARSVRSLRARPGASCAPCAPGSWRRAGPGPARRPRRPARDASPAGAALQHSVIRRGPPAAYALAA